jgi:hypothetical protein
LGLAVRKRPLGHGSSNSNRRPGRQMVGAGSRRSAWMLRRGQAVCCPQPSRPRRHPSRRHDQKTPLDALAPAQLCPQPRVAGLHFDDCRTRWRMWDEGVLGHWLGLLGVRCGTCEELFLCVDSSQGLPESRPPSIDHFISLLMSRLVSRRMAQAEPQGPSANWTTRL